MPTRIYLASGNPGKLKDFGGVAGVAWDLLPGFAALPIVEETGDTFESNARLKAEQYSAATAEFVLADDSGLEVDALGGAPGVHSARYAGRHGDDLANNRLLLERLGRIPAAERTARFRCVLALARAGETIAVFSGAAEGIILEGPRGEQGFGYDPLFYSPEAGRGFGELEPADKARYSHRGRAARELLAWLQTKGI